MTAGPPINAGHGVLLEWRWDVPSSGEPGRAVVFCHPHPLQRGTMNAPLMNQVTHQLTGIGFGVLRFNFRGVGSSTGRWGEGVGEVDDVAAAVAFAREHHPALPLSIIGWSFGAATALQWQARDGDGMPYVGIAPPVDRPGIPALPGASQLAQAPRTFVIGDRDQFTTVDDLERYAAGIDASVRVLTGSDHFFYFREDRVVAAIVEGLGGNPPG